MAPPKGSKPRPYRDFLTPALHRQFVYTSLLSLCICYLPAVLMSQDGFPWLLLPFATGFRALVLFIVCSMGVLLIRLAGQHVGRSTAVYPFKSVRRALLDPTTYFSVSTYFLSAFLFGEVFAWSHPAETKIYLVHPQTHDERARLNERGILFRSLFPILAFVQLAFHLHLSLDRLRIPAQKLSVQGSRRLSQVFDPTIFAFLALTALFKSAVATVIGFLAYFAIYRVTLWHLWFELLRYLYRFPQNSALKKSSLDGGLYVAVRFTFAAFLLTFIWDATNYVFSEYMAEAPLKKGQPITNDSKDPNGSLIAGLKAKQQLVKTQAFWELALISTRFETRRKSIYIELDRPGGSTWTQLHSLCVAELKAVDERIAAFNAPAQTQPPSSLSLTDAHVALNRTPKVDSNVYSPSANKLSDIRDVGVTDYAKYKIHQLVKSQGSQPGATNPPVALAEMGAQKLLTQGQRDNFTMDGIQNTTGALIQRVLLTPVGSQFRQTFERRVTGLVCGTPYSRASIIVDAVEALSKLAVHSITEDQPGQVQKDIAAIARVMAGSIRKIESFVASAPAHWTDVYFTENKRRDVPDVLAVIAALKAGLEEIMRAFGEYFGALGITAREQTEWRNLLQPRPAISET